MLLSFVPPIAYVRHAHRPAALSPGFMARLSALIRQNVEPILAEWETFARSLAPGDAMDIVALRDHAKDMLFVIADDLDDPQTAKQQSDKSRGESDAVGNAVLTSAQEHGAGRAESGFTVAEMVAEFRALRASVMRLWSHAQQAASTEDLVDMTRFNEAIDQAIAESITQYTENIGQTKERFLAILGHDLRSPVAAIVTSTRFMLETAEQKGDLGQPYRKLIHGVSRSARRMNQLVADLLEFARVRLGESIPIARAPMDLGPLTLDVVAEVRAAYPDRKFNSSVTGDLRGEWDWDRLFQALTNLVSNAVQHGSTDSPIRMTASAEGNDVVLSVANSGEQISKEQLARLFQGINQHSASEGRDRRHLGLGLYIVDKIVTAHGGRVGVESTDAGETTFSLRLPRSAAAK